MWSCRLEKNKRLHFAMATVPGKFARAGLLMHRVWLQFWLERKVGGNRTPNIRLQRRGRDGKASRTGTAASWPKNILHGLALFTRHVTLPLTICSATT